MAVLESLVDVFSFLLCNGPLPYHLRAMSLVLEVGFSGLHEVVLKLSYATIKLKVLLIQGCVEVTLVAAFSHSELTFRSLIWRR